MDDELLVFTKYPVPGRVKTRLIPAIGAEAAALLHRRLTEQTLDEMSKLPARLKVCYDGATRTEMQDWLGELELREQGSGNLGERLGRAVALSFREGARRVVVIGTDAPALTAETVRGAFRLLENIDLVLGPAHDGGYYLIGLSRPAPELFIGIEWSSERVLRQTLAAAAGLRVALLQEMADIDRPEDLALLEN